MKNKLSQQLVIGGIASALIIISLYGGSIIRTSKLAFMVLATFIASFPYILGSKNVGVLTYISSAALSFLILPNKLYGAVFALFGNYPLIKLLAEEKRILFEYLIKYIWFNIVVIVYYFAFRSFIFIDSFFTNNIGIVILIILLEVLFLVYDFVFTKFIMFSQDRVLKYLRKN